MLVLPVLSLALQRGAWYECRKERGITGGSLKAIREQRTDRMWAVNRGKQGRAEDSVTLRTPSSAASSHTLAQRYLLHTALPMAPHIFQQASALSSANSRLTPSWPGPVTNGPGDNTFFTLLLSLSLGLTRYLSHTPFVCTSPWPFSPQALRLFWWLSSFWHNVYSDGLEPSHCESTFSAGTQPGVQSVTCGSAALKNNRDLSGWDGLWLGGVKQKLHVNVTWGLRGRGRN